MPKYYFQDTGDLGPNAEDYFIPLERDREIRRTSKEFGQLSGRRKVPFYGAGKGFSLGKVYIEVKKTTEMF